MKKKPLILALIFLTIPILTVATVQAGKGTEKVYYELNLVVPQATGYLIEDIRFAPPETATPNVVFLTMSEIYHEDFTLQIGEETFTPDRSAELQVTRNWHQTFVLIKISETYTFDGVDGTIEISATGKVKNYGTPNAMSDVKVVGHGTGYFESVKILAEGGSEPGNPDHKIHIGAIMGWPGLPI